MLNCQILLTTHDKDRFNATTSTIKSVQIVFVTLQNKNEKKIADPMTRLLGGPEMFLDTISGIVNLTCVIETLSPPQSVSWYHNQSKVGH